MVFYKGNLFLYVCCVSTRPLGKYSAREDDEYMVCGQVPILAWCCPQFLSLPLLVNGHIIFLSFPLYFVDGFYDWDFLLALPLDRGVTGRAWACKRAYIPFHLSELLTFKCIAFKVMPVESYLSDCLLILAVYFNKSKVWVSCNKRGKKWGMNNSFRFFFFFFCFSLFLHDIKIANICLWQITSQNKPPSAYFIEAVCQVWIQPWWQ